MKVTLLFAIACMLFLTAYTAAQAEDLASPSEKLYQVWDSAPMTSQEKLQKRQSAKQAAILNAAYAARLELASLAAEDIYMND